jgi:hypothetical protein
MSKLLLPNGWLKEYGLAGLAIAAASHDLPSKAPGDGQRRMAIELAMALASGKVRRSITTLVLLTLCLGLASGLDHESTKFRAYDCTDRQEMGKVVVGDRRDCARPRNATSQEPASYHVVQEAKYRRLTGRRCHILTSHLAFYCGDHDHQTFVPEFSKISQRQTIRASECREMWNSKTYVDESGQKHKLLTSTTTEVRSQVAGRTFAWTHSDVQCVGGTITHMGRTKSNMIIWEHSYVTLETVPLVVDRDDGIILENSQIRTGCFLSQLGCATEVGTITWSKLTARGKCQYFKTRPTTGIEVADDTGMIMYISQDGSMTRLQRMGVVELCGHNAFKTSYTNLFLVTPGNADHFDPPQSTLELSTLTYTNAQDEFLVGHLTDYIRTEFQAIAQHNCLRDKKSAQADFASKAAEQHAVTDGDTTSLGDGWFATTAGEVWYHYQCRPIYVYGRSLPKCYSSMPVELVEHDRVSILTAKGMSTNETEEPFFLEPHTRRLTHAGLESVCTTEMVSSYQNTAGAWIDVTPSLRDRKSVV